MVTKILPSATIYFQKGVILTENIVQDMANNHESHRIVNEGDKTIVTLRPMEITSSLQGKMSEADIARGATLIGEQFEYQRVIGELYRQCHSVECIQRNACYFRTIPNGSTNASVMFVNKMPSQYEACSMCSHNDKGALMLTVLLDKMHVSRKDVYCTDMIKCHCDNLDEQSFKNCISTYFMKEILHVKPKVVIFNGMAALKTLNKLGYIAGLPDEISYGKIYPVTVTPCNIGVKVMAIYDLDKVLQKNGNEVAECKTALWQHALAAFRDAGVIPPAT